MIEEFKVFLTKGNLITLGVGFIMGVAFSTVVSSLVENLLMPIIAIPFGEPDFSALTWTVNGSVINYGAFITSLAVFILTAAGAFFLIVKPYNAWTARTPPEPEEDDTPSELEILSDIRDLLAGD